MSNTYDYDIPTVVTAAGLQPTPPAQLQQAIIAGVTPTNPDYTATLPASLIEDTLDTEIAGAVLIDQAKVETVNSLTPYGANDFLLIQLGNQAGIEQAGATNTSVYVVFSGTPGFVIVQGFIVGDGTYQYVVQEPGGIIGASGTSQPLLAIATQAGSWAVPSGSVTQPSTSVPTNIQNAGFSVSNPTPGTPGGAAQSSVSFRQAALQANYAIVQGAQSLLKTQLAQVPNVQARLVSVAQQPGGGWEIIAGGGDPYFVGYAIYRGIGDISSLVGSTLNILSISDGYPAVITTDKNHLFSNGQIVTMLDITSTGNMFELNNVPFAIEVLTDTSFTVNFTANGTYNGDGVVTPNLRNMTVAINDYPNVYEVPYVNPPTVTVAMTVTWQTVSTSFVSEAAVSQLAGPALVNYINNTLIVGQPINKLELEQVFLEAVATVLPGQLISSLTFTVSLNGAGVAFTGTLIFPEPNSTVQESQFNTNTGLILITQA